MAPVRIGEAVSVLDEVLELRAEVDDLKAGSDRLARILAVETGDVDSAPEGWSRIGGGWGLRPDAEGEAEAYVSRRGEGQWVWQVMGSWRRSDAPTALEAMEAADRARGAGEVSDG